MAALERQPELLDLSNPAERLVNLLLAQRRSIGSETIPARLVPVTCTLTSDQPPSFIIQAPVAGFYEVEMQYAFSGSRRRLTMVRNNMSYAACMPGVTSPSTLREVGRRSPSMSLKPGAAAFDVKVVGGNSYDRFEIKSCIARRIPSVDDYHLDADQEVLRTPRAK